MAASFNHYWMILNPFLILIIDVAQFRVINVDTKQNGSNVV